MLHDCLVHYKYYRLELVLSAIATHQKLVEIQPKVGEGYLESKDTLRQAKSVPSLRGIDWLGEGYLCSRVPLAYLRLNLDELRMGRYCRFCCLA